MLKLSPGLEPKSSQPPLANEISKQVQDLVNSWIPPSRLGEAFGVAWVAGMTREEESTKTSGGKSI